MDAQGQTLGRLARNIAIALQGKDKTTYSAHVAVGDFVVVTNASDLPVTGKKMEQKMYYRHSGYVGNLKTFRLREMMENCRTFLKPRCRRYFNIKTSSRLQTQSLATVI